MTSASMAVPTRRVDMWYAGTTPQRRVTVVFRIILAIPQFIVLFFLGIAAFFVVLIGWFGALFTGRFPEFAHTFISGLVRWEIRVGAYMFLLTDSYPPFSLEDVDYPVRIVLPPRGRFNRVSVFFRFFLAIPAFVFSQIVANGLSFPLLFVMWIVVLVRGSMPPSLYNAYSALLRYQARFHSWYNLLTSEYPWGMLGDFVPPPPVSPPPPLGAASGSAQTAPAPPPPPPPVPQGGPSDSPTSPRAQPYAYPQTGEQVPVPPPDAGAAPTPPGWPPPQPAPSPGAPGTPGAMPPPSPWERTATPSSVDPLPPWGVLILQGAARSWMIFAIVWGSIVFVGQIARDFGHGHNNNTTNGLIITVPADTSGLSHVVVPPPSDR
jgi:Domain of unknown function (DUF4389)